MISNRVITGTLSGGLTPKRIFGPDLEYLFIADNDYYTADQMTEEAEWVDLSGKKTPSPTGRWARDESANGVPAIVSDYMEFNESEDDRLLFNDYGFYDDATTGNTAGTFYLIGYDLETAGNYMSYFDISQGNDDRLLLALNSSNQFIMNQVWDGVSSPVTFTPTVDRTEWHHIIAKQTGTGYYAEINGTSLGTPTGDGTTWFKDSAVNRGSMGANFGTNATSPSSVTYAYRLKMFAYVSRASTTNEDNTMRQWMTDKFG